MGKRFYYELAGIRSFKELVSRWQSEFLIQVQPLQRALHRYYDTFDFRLFQKQLRFGWNGTKLFLQWEQAGHADLICMWDREPLWVEDLPECKLRQSLAGIIEPRAVLPIFNMQKEIYPVKFLDREKKTVCFVFIEKNTVIAGGVRHRLPLLLCLVPLQGYYKWGEMVDKWLQENAGKKIESDPFRLALQKLRIRPEKYTTRLNLHFPADCSLYQAVQIILRQQLSIIEQNRPGILQDIDTEFLHDVRVAVRRIRSLFGQLRDYFSESVYYRARADFPALIKKTNTCRDLDVFIRRQSLYRSQLPLRYRSAISPFFTQLMSRRQQEHKKILLYFRSDRYTDLIQFWDNLFKQKPAGYKSTGIRAVSLRGVAGKIILKRYLKTVNLHKDLTTGLSDGFLHRVRIECKKLRYALEFFQPLFDHKPVRVMIKKLRKLQDTLGEYNDLSIQQNQMTNYISSLTGNDPATRQTIRAVNYLITGIQKRKQLLHIAFRESFNDFCNPVWQQKVTRILTDGQRV